MKEATTKGARCSCCGKAQEQVNYLSDLGEGKFLCDECIEICLEILEGEGIATDAVPQSSKDDFPWRKTSYSCSFCGMKQREVARLIAMLNDLFICNSCVGKYAAALEETKKQQRKSDTDQQPQSQEEGQP
jgi:ATP-dependent protease Clp ATPase subunit